jgi:group I intron endonuclease
MLQNNVNGKRYVGSSGDLRKRIVYYYNIKYLNKYPTSLICRSLLKYGHSNFSFCILEYCDLPVLSDREQLIEREQYYLDTLNPEYNLLKIADSFAGHKHMPETIEK